MRTLELLRALNDREIKDFEELLNSQKRKTLPKLYGAIKKYRKIEGVPATEELFELIFKKEYTADKNYLLRNELRLLNELFYNFFIDITFSDYIKKHKSTYNYWLARAFFERKLNSAFAADIDRFVAFNKAYIKPEDTALLLDLKSLWMIYNEPKTLKNVTQQIDATEQWKDEQIRFLRYRLREVESRKAYLETTLASISGEKRSEKDDWRTTPQMEISFGDMGSMDKYEQYLVLKKYSYQTAGQARIDVLKQMLAIEEGEEYTSEYSAIASQLASLNAIAMEYILLGNFVEGDKFLQESITRSEGNNLPVIFATLQNYISNQINLGNYQKGIDYYNFKRELIEKGRQYVQTSIAKVYCHLFLGQTDEALASLPLQAQLTDHQQLMVRMVYLIVFIIRKQYDLAVNENQNIGRMIKARQGSYFEIYLSINGLYLKYLNAIVKQRNLRRDEFLVIKKELLTNHNLMGKLEITEFSLRWFKTQL
jgi:hypothetical protein